MTHVEGKTAARLLVMKTGPGTSPTPVKGASLEHPGVARPTPSLLVYSSAWPPGPRRTGGSDGGVSVQASRPVDGRSCRTADAGERGSQLAGRSLDPPRHHGS